MESGSTILFKNYISKNTSNTQNYIMAAYELIKELEALPYFNDLLKAGIVPVNWIDYKVIYEFYVRELKRLKALKEPNCKGLAKTNTADEYKISERSVYLIIQKMRG